MPQFQYVVLPKRSCHLPTGQGGRASVERPIGAGHLQDTLSVGNEKWEKNNERLILFVSLSI